MSRLSSDCRAISSTVASQLSIFLKSVMTIVSCNLIERKNRILPQVGSSVWMLKLSWRLGLLTVMTIPLLAIVTTLQGQYFDVRATLELRIGRFSQALYEKMTKASAETTSVITEVQHNFLISPFGSY